MIYGCENTGVCGTRTASQASVQAQRYLDLQFIAKVLSLSKRQTEQVRGLIAGLYLHGLASGDFELALRELLGGRSAVIGIIVTGIPHLTNSSMMGVDFLFWHAPLLLLAVS